ncbi:MAG TPA: D-alanyl-D-alanine carboxypeptidase [Pyrinomonadaceae bacterium]|nr:D-alanyl-D-alanine carboxypeptidase [Pyrinomonadaceae bacterium]
MNARKPIFAMLAAGLLAVLALTFTPYALLQRARQTVAAVVRLEESPTLEEIARQRPPSPPFDVVGFYAGRGEDPARHGVLVQSLDGRQTFAEHNADAAFNPASLVKLATSLVALRKLGKGFRFETRVYVEGEPDKAGALKGRLVVAGGDPTFGDVSGVLIAKKLEARGIKNVPEEIAVTADFTFNFSGKPEESAERLARVMKMTPKKWAVVDSPPTAPAFVVHSYPLSEILLYMNAHSSNFVAERLGALVGGPEGVRAYLVNELKLPAEQVTLATTSGLEINRLTPRGIVAVIRALDAEAARQGLKTEDIMPVASGDYGTLRKRLAGTPLEGAVVGKTGTLVHDDGGMASLGGVVYTQRAGKLCFVVLSQGSNVAERRSMTDQLLVQVVLSRDLPAQIPRPDKPRHMLERDDLEITEEQ